MTLFVTWFIRLEDRQRKFLLYFLAVLGKWSMLDVFITAIIIVWVKLGPFADAQAEKGVYYFGLSILMAMAATTVQSYLIKRSHKT